MKIFITGGTSGIGKALAEAYLKEGHTVAVCGRDVSRIKRDKTTFYDNLQCFEVNVCDKEKLDDAICEFARGELDLLIANAGISGPKDSPLVDFSRGRDMILTNVVGVFNAFETAQRLMIPRKRGHLVAISSVAALAGLPRTGPYCASKAAVLRLCETMSMDLAPLGVDVSVVLPGFVETPLTAGNLHPMPWIMSAEHAAAVIKKAVASKKKTIVFPWQMKFVMCFLEKIPRPFYRYLMRYNKFFKER